MPASDQATSLMGSMLRCCIQMNTQLRCDRERSLAMWRKEERELGSWAALCASESRDEAAVGK